MLTKKQKLSVLAVALILLGGLAFASFSSANDLQGKIRDKFRNPRNIGTEQVRQIQNSYDVRQGRNRDDGPPEPPPPISNLGDIDVPPPEVSNNLAPDVPEPLPDGASNNIGLDDIIL